MKSAFAPGDVGGSSLSVSSTNALADGNQTIRVTVQARTSHGEPIVAVALNVAAPGCVVNQSALVTDANGSITATLQSTIVGSHAVSASLIYENFAQRIATTTLVNFVLPVPGRAVSAGTTLDVAVMVEDAEGHPDSSYTGVVQFTCTDPAASLPADITLTAAEGGYGYISRGVTFRTAGVQTLTAVDAVTQTVLYSVTYIVSPLTTARLALLGLAATTGAGTTQPLAVSAYDVLNNLTPAYRGVVSFSSSDPNAVFPSAYTFAPADAGSHSFATGVSFATQGTQTVTVNDMTTGGLSDTLTTQVVSAPATHVQLTVATHATAGVATTVQITVLDSFGNHDSTYTGTMTLITSDSGVAPVNYTFQPADAGSKSLLLTFQHAGTQTIAAKDNANQLSAQGTVLVQSGAFNSLVMSGLNPNAVAGVPMTVQLQAYDAWGNTDTHYLGLIAFQSTDPLAILPTPYYAFSTTDAGVATFSFTFFTAGLQSVTLRDITTFVNLGGNVQVSPQPQAKVFQVAVQPNTTTAGIGVTPTVKAVDAYGNIVTTYTGAVSFTTDDPNATLPDVSTFVHANAGVLTWPGGVVWTRAGVRPLSVMAVAGALQGNTTVPVVAAAPSHLAFLTKPASTTACTPLSALQVGAQDAYGNTVALTSPVFMALQPNARAPVPLYGALVHQPVSNVATFADLSIGQVGGPYVLVASSPPLGSAHTSAFSTTASNPTLTLGTPTVARGVATLPYTVQSACPVTVLPSYDPNHSGVYSPMHLVAGGLGVQNLPARTAVARSIAWNTVREMPQMNGSATLKLTATSVAGQNSATASIPVANTTLFASAMAQTAPLAQLCAASADVNHDGVIDWLTCNSNNVIVWLGDPNNSGNLTSSGSYAVGFTPTALVAADFNRDGAVDALVAAPGNSNVVFLSGNNTGALGAPVASPFSAGVVALSTADISGDGILDVMGVAGASGGNVLLWSLGAGDGTFHSVQSVSSAGTPSALALGDFNRDGYWDAAVAQTTGVSLMFGVLGGFQAVSTTLVAPTSTQCVSTADINLDGNLDLVMGGSSGWRVDYGNPNGVFALGASGTSPSAIASVGIGDMNIDGWPDVILGGAAAGTTPTVLLTSATTVGATSISLNTSSGIRALAIADVNRDGQPDVLTADMASTVSIYLNGRQATATTGLGANLVGPTQPNAVIFATGADVNEDGLVDSVSLSNSPQNVLGVSLNDGSGHVVFSKSVPVGNQPIDALLVDVNRDGHLDALVINARESSLMTLLGDGTGTFTLARRQFVGQTPYALANGDFDGDGIPDVAVAANADNNMTILRGMGDGNFVTTGVYPAGINPFSMAVGDVDGNGSLDIVVADGDGAGGLYMFYNAGDGTFLAEPGVQNGTEAIYRSPVETWLCDFNNDHALDLLQSSNNGLSIQLNVGGSVSYNGNNAASFGVYRTSTVIPADVNQDGNMDVITSLYNTYGAFVLFGKGNGSAAAGPINNFVIAAGTLLFSADMNGDGLPDIYQGDYSTSATGQNGVIFHDGGSRYYLAPMVGSVNTYGNYMTGLLADIDRDGQLDPWVQTVGSAGTSPASLTAFNGANFGTTATYLLGLGGTGFAVGDIDNDGWADLVACDSNAWLHLFTNNNHTGALTAVNPTTLPFVPSTPAIGDINRDGWRDIVVLNANNATTVGYFPNSGTGTFGATLTNLLVVSGDTLTAFAVGDVDNNGTPDVVALGSHNVYVKLVSATGNPVGSTSADASFSNTMAANGITLADINRDGKLDIILVGSGIGVSLGNGTASFGAPTSTLSQMTALRYVVTHDFNQDGIPDVLTSSNTTSPVALLAFADGQGGFASVQTLGKPTQGANLAALATGDLNKDGFPDVATFYAASTGSNFMAMWYGRP